MQVVYQGCFIMSGGLAISLLRTLPLATALAVLVPGDLAAAGTSILGEVNDTVPVFVTNHVRTLHVLSHVKQQLLQISQNALSHVSGKPPPSSLLRTSH